MSHDRRTRRRAIPAALTATSALVALVLTGCVAGGSGSAGSPTPPPTVAPSPSPTAPPDLVVPETQPGEVARVVYDEEPAEGPPTRGSILGVVEPDVAYMVRGECVGAEVTYDILRADVGGDGETLMSGTFECGETVASGSFASPYAGPVQLAIGSPAGITRAWLVVVPVDG